MTLLSPTAMRRSKIAGAILKERMLQEQRWSAAHDRKNTMMMWAALASAYAARIWTSDTPRAALIKLAAICVAALEALDANPDALTDEEEAILRHDQVCTPQRRAQIDDKIAKLRGEASDAQEA